MYTIRELAELAGVTTRTLRYYDQIGLLKPSSHEHNIRRYSNAEIDKLQQILFYRELRLDLKTIQSIMDDDGFETKLALKQQFDALTAEHERLTTLLNTLAETIQSVEGNRPMTNEEKFDGFKRELVTTNEENYGQEVREQYGDDAMDASNAKMLKMDEATYNAFRALEEEIKHKLLKAAVQTQNVQSAEAEELVQAHKEWLAYTWLTYTADMHQGLAEMYVGDDRFAKYYNDAVPGGAQFLRDAILKWAK